jgi:hypothetical protein
MMKRPEEFTEFVRVTIRPEDCGPITYIGQVRPGTDLSTDFECWSTHSHTVSTVRITETDNDAAYRP